MIQVQIKIHFDSVDETLGSLLFFPHFVISATVTDLAEESLNQYFKLLSLIL